MRGAGDSGVGVTGLLLGTLGQLQVELTAAASMNSHCSGEKDTLPERQSREGEANPKQKTRA